MNVAFDPSNKSDHPRIAVGDEEGHVSVHNLDHSKLILRHPETCYKTKTNFYYYHS